MTENTYYKPRLVIGNHEILKGMSGTINFPGNNQANSLTCSITDPDFQNYRLFNKEIKLYLNYGSDDGIPIFRGYIKTVSPNDSKLNISAIDGRTFINSGSSKMLELTDKENYDGFTLAAFLYDYINDKVNINNNTYIGLDMLKDTNPSITINGLRTKASPPYKIAVDKLQEAVDDDDLEKPLRYFIDMVDDGTKSNITFIKEKQLTEVPSLSLSFRSGIKNYSYNRRAPANFAVGGGSSFTYGNSPQGPIGMKIEGQFKDRNEARQKMIQEILLQYRETDEITLNCTKGHYIGIGSIVDVIIDEEDIGGKHRVTSKSIQFSDNKVGLSLSLNKKPILLSEYISNIN